MAELGDWWSIALTNDMIEHSRLSLDELLAFYGIDTSKPYAGRHEPRFHAHVYRQQMQYILVEAARKHGCQVAPAGEE